MGKLVINKSDFDNIVKECVDKAVKKHICLTEATSSISGMKSNSVNRFLPISKERSILSEGIDWAVDEDLRGGTIVFSTDVNAVKLSENGVLNFVKQKIATLKNRLNATSQIDKIANANNLVGWTIGHNYDGRYAAKNGKNFGENSLTLDIVGVKDDVMVKIAEEICRVFLQECVLLKLTNGKVYFINQD